MPAKKFGKNRWNILHVLWIQDEDEESTERCKPPGKIVPPLVALPTQCFLEAAKKALKERHGKRV